ncbi:MULTISPECIES: copper resistance system multicopper oxidase [Acidobacterium]|uniref:Copper resistance protein A n=1 Tax=Acidobacterium capsulatum (strain ATCC 51196 / DSM 11244 / BCRC 80197 / JCM 7670 / NBRC 15755 / NCIMB 13165 / 161) TaxID=240015 RepID=C1F1R6_ACIC5|nr:MULTISPECIES: copper resistance system multicopper oxidase [Acidobacterium]ACO33430.1 copper resistance protein A [Acidobacterium capsulatum ATCC 51196]HCT60009.1 copper resistance system multicopper oxidase [Acidobacterium sp.]
MSAADRSIPELVPISRRRFVQGIAAGAAIAALDGHALPTFAEAAPYHPPVLAGTHFDLTIDTLPVNFTGRRARALAVNGSVPGPTLRWRQGDTVSIAVTNRMRVPTSVHWHSLRLPNPMDGVPGLTYRGIMPGETFHYRFPVLQNGTAWYHSHTRFQEQSGLSGAIIIDPRGTDPVQADRDYVIFLSDWTDTNPETVFSNLKENSDYYNYERITAGGFFHQAKQQGLGKAISARLAWARMNMSPSDISDVSGATYTYLLNGNSPARNWTGLFQRGEKLRLRFINGSSMTFFDVRIPGLKMTVVQADGNYVEPVPVDEFRIGVAERYDVLIEPEDNRAYTIFAQSEDRSGYARGTLAPRPGMTAPVPPMDPVPRRTMADMGMAMKMNMSGMASMAGIDGMTAKDAQGMDVQKMNAQKINQDMPGMNMPGGSMSEMNMRSEMSGMKMRGNSMPGMAMSAMTAEESPEPPPIPGSFGKTPFPQPWTDTHPAANVPESAIHAAEAKLQPADPVHLHPGPQVAEVARHVESRLNQPGDGLNHNGRRVLTYADLRARFRGVDDRPPTREIELHLTGNMNRYIWGFNGEKFSQAEPIVLRLGERVRFVLINDTMMEHPIHLHGLWSELENGHGPYRPFKDTIIVKPAERVSYLVSADTPGRWAYHCHLLYHMEAGMFRTVVVLP